MKRLDVAEMYKRHPQLKEDDVKMIKAWMDKQPHLPKITGRHSNLIKLKISFSLGIPIFVQKLKFK